MIFLVPEYDGDVKFTPITPSEVPHFAQDTLHFPRVYGRAVYRKSRLKQSYTKLTSCNRERKLCMRVWFSQGRKG